MKWLLSLLLVLADDLAKAGELTSTDAMLTKKAHTSLAIVDCVN
jgi:hypothetical protein